MKFVNIKLSLLGTWCHDWPRVSIQVNNQTLYCDQVQDQIDLSFDVPLQDNNTLIIQHFDKNFGQNGQWDTISENNVIVKDRAVRLISFLLDDIELKDYLTQQCVFETDQGAKLHTDYYGYNGQVQITFGSPVYDWIIENIVKEQTQNLFDLAQPIDTSFDNLFDYDRDLVELEELEKLLDKHAHLFDKSSKI